MSQFKSEEVSISLIVTEVELVMLPSFKAEFRIVIPRSHGEITCSDCCVWFEIDDWEEFVTSLSSGGQSGEVADMSQDVRISLCVTGIRTNVKIGVRLCAGRIGDGQINLDFSGSSELREQFWAFAQSVQHQYKKFL